jgi:hypothetical protein
MTIELTGTVALTRLIVRRDWMRALIWITAIAVVEVLTTLSTTRIYSTQADLSRAAAATHGNAAAIAINGPDQGLDTIGGQVAFQIGATGLVSVALMAVFMIGRETRAEEETGRLDLVRAMAVGRHSATAAALIVVAGMSAVLGTLVALGLVGLGLPARGSILFGATLCAEGLVFAGVTVVVAQFTENTDGVRQRRSRGGRGVRGPCRRRYRRGPAELVLPHRVGAEGPAVRRRPVVAPPDHGRVRHGSREFGSRALESAGHRRRFHQAPSGAADRDAGSRPAARAGLPAPARQPDRMGRRAVRGRRRRGMDRQ